MTLSSVQAQLYLHWLLSLVNRAMASTKSGVLSTIISTMQMLASPESVEFKSFKEVAVSAGIYLASSAVANTVYAAANAETLVAMGRTVMGFAALGMCVSASLGVGQVFSLFYSEAQLVLNNLEDPTSVRATVAAGLPWCCGWDYGVHWASNRRTPPRYNFNQVAWGHSTCEVVLLCDTVILKFNTSPLFTDALSLATMSIFLAVNEWMGIIVPIRDMAVELNLQFCIFLLGVLGAFAMYRKLANRKVSDSESQVPWPRSGQIIFAITLLLLTGVYYLPLLFRASGRSESLAGLIIPPFMGSIFISLIGLTSLKNPFEIVPLAVAVIAPLALTVAFYRANGQLPACSFIGIQIICVYPFESIRVLMVLAGAGIRYSSLMGQATEFLDTISGVVDASRIFNFEEGLAVLARIYHNFGQVNYMLSHKRLPGDGGSADVAGCISKESNQENRVGNFLQTGAHVPKYGIFRLQPKWGEGQVHCIVGGHWWAGYAVSTMQCTPVTARVLKVQILLELDLKEENVKLHEVRWTGIMDRFIEGIQNQLASEFNRNSTVGIMLWRS
ncbi:hypothetical protein B0H14DRAFT_3145704 [Mycena olivaceomarginata]|nr:hypothetical protein B0H14DRAFT_3145704 [Mycena olivaceomarginata]